MTTQQIGYFLKLAEELNFTNVARIFFITQPTLSKQIVNLENELNTTLFYRERNSVRLTEAGQRFYNRMKPIFLDLMDAIRDAQTYGNEGDSLVIGVQEEQLASNSLMLAINKLHHQYPDLKISIHRDSFENLKEDMENGKYDILNLLFFHEAKLSEKLNFEKIEDECMYLAYSEKMLQLPEIITKNELSEVAQKYDIILPIVYDDVDEQRAKSLFFEKALDNVDSTDINIRISQSGRAISLPIQVVSQLGISLCNRTNMFSIDPKTKISKIEGTEGSYSKGLVYRKQPDNPYVRLLLNLEKQER